MAFVIGIFKFIFAFVAIASTALFILNCISSIINPKIATNEKGEVVETNANSRYIFALIMSVAWALVIALP